MKYDLEQFEKRVEQGYLRKSETEDLILYGYTDRCTFDRAWDEYTTIARGLILEKATGEVVAKCFPKFFNLGEREETMLANLPAELGYTTQEKVDGSLGIIFNYKGKWTVATRGSFYSPQAQKAQELLKRYDLSFGIDESYTLLAEIIYPENKIVVNYGSNEALVLLAVYDRETGEEKSPMSLRLIEKITGMPGAKTYGMTINQMIKLQKNIPKDEEGFVVRFGNGLRVKIKGEEYMKVSRILANMSPLSLWEAMYNGKVPKQYLMQVPEEFRHEYEPMVNTLENKYSSMQDEIIEDLKTIPQYPGGILSREGRKHVALFVQNSKDLKHPKAIFQALYGSDLTLADKYIMNHIRPTGNVLKVANE